MRQSQLLIPTTKEIPSDASIPSHQLMLRSGLIRQIASGLYAWLPLGLRVLHKIEAIIREELNRSGAQELLMPIVQPKELWQETGRWDKMGVEMLRMQDRHQRDFCLGPTHEEVITDLFRREIHSYRALPCNFYQIQTKFRDEVRPRFGVMRAREFTMKDGYSFHADEESFQQTYQEMYRCYSRILERFSLEFRPVEADSGNIGGANSHEFHVLAESGEDIIAYCPQSDYAANLEKASAAKPAPASNPTESLARVATPGITSIEAVSSTLGIPTHQTLKTLIVRGTKGPIGLVLRGDHDLNTVKAVKCSDVADPLELATDTEIVAATGVEPGSLGPVNAKIPLFVDRDAFSLNDFVCGANETGYHLTGVNWLRDTTVTADRVMDLRNVVPGDRSPDGAGTLAFIRGIEVGHIFQLGRLYSASMAASVLDQSGKPLIPIMGCYGMGVTRLVAAIIEQKHDDVGILWPPAVAPFQVHLIALNYGKSQAVQTATDSLYQQFLADGIEILFDDRNERPGVKFADADLLGIPLRVTVGDRGLKNGTVEFRRRDSDDSEDVALSDIAERLRA